VGQHTTQRHSSRTRAPNGSCLLARQHNQQHAASSQHTLLCRSLSAASAHAPQRRNSRHLCAAAGPDWEFEFDKNPQNTEQPVVSTGVGAVVSLSVSSTETEHHPNRSACALSLAGDAQPHPVPSRGCDSAAAGHEQQ
jgi:hypothetical protein